MKSKDFIDTPKLVSRMLSGCVFRRVTLIKSVRSFLGCLTDIAKRAAKLNDPELNILMLRLHLYDVDENKVEAEIQSQMNKIVKLKKKKLCQKEKTKTQG